MDVLLVDSSGLLAAIDAGEPEHGRVSELIARDRRPLVVTDYVIAEVDYLVMHRLGLQAEHAFIEQVLDGIFSREPVTDADLRRALEIGARFSEHNLGITDATMMAVGERLGARQVLTLDRRHFSVYRNRRGRALDLLP